MMVRPQLDTKSNPKIDSIIFEDSLSSYKNNGNVVYKRGTDDINIFVLIDEGESGLQSEHIISLESDNPACTIKDPGLTTKNGKNAEHFSVDIESTSAVGIDSITANLNYDGNLVSEKTEDIYVIFNAEDSSTPEYVGSGSIRNAFKNDERSVWWRIPHDIPKNIRTTRGKGWDYNTQHYSSTVFIDHAINIVDGKTSPGDAVKALNRHLHDMIL